MTRALRLIAPAKINWSLEILRFRPDGYHEIRSVMQTIDLHDVVTLTPAAGIELQISGERGTLADEPPETNLAYRAAAALRERTGAKSGVRIELEKHIPVAAGLGGGSSDAAAVLRGLNQLWDTRQPENNLVEIAGEIGSDPPFFVVAGAAVVSGRGEHVEALDDARAPAILLATPPAQERGDKTAGMFGALTPDHFSDGDVTIGVREAVASGREITDGELNNVFERVTAQMQPETALAMRALDEQGVISHLAGAGPSFFVLLTIGRDERALAARIRELGFEPRPARATSRGHARRIEEL